MMSSKIAPRSSEAAEPQPPAAAGDPAADLAARVAELESFSYSVSHDLRAPVRAIDGFARVLLEEHGDQLNAEARRVVGIIQDNAQQMGRLIDGLLALSRLGRQELRPRRIDVGALARGVFAEVAAAEPERAISIEVGELPAADADPGMLRQVLVNLLANAVKFTRRRDAARIEVDGRRDGAWAIYRVRDNGVGFDPRYAGKLFGVFQRLHLPEDYEGTGVGLAIVRRIVERHGGRVWAEGAVDAGAAVSLTLPAAPGDAAAQAQEGRH